MISFARRGELESKESLLAIFEKSVTEGVMNWLATYIVICLLVGISGMNRKLGFWGYFFASFALTPVIGILLVVCSDRRKEFK